MNYERQCLTQTSGVKRKENSNTSNETGKSVGENYFELVALIGKGFDKHFVPNILQNWCRKNEISETRGGVIFSKDI